MNSEIIFNRLAVIIKEVYGRTDIDINTTINSFNAVSEDNDEFLKRFHQEFDVDMNGFDYYVFFREDQFYLLALWNLILKLLGKGERKESLTIDHLVKVAQNRRWSSPSEKQ